MNYTDPLKVGFGRFLGRFHEQLIGDTPAVREFAGRQFSKAAVWAPGRMVDKVTEMLEAWRKNDTSQSAQPTPFLPVMIAAADRGFMPTPPEFGRLSGEWSDVVLPADPKQRLFQMRTVSENARVQVVIAAADPPSAKSIVMQLQGFCTEMHNRRFAALHRFAGMESEWPVVLTEPDVIAIDSPTDQKNITLLALDITLATTTPMLRAPKSSEPNDGKGSGPNQDDPFAPGHDPNGYPVVMEAIGLNYPPLLGATAMGEWTVSARGE